MQLTLIVRQLTISPPALVLVNVAAPFT